MTTTTQIVAMTSDQILALTTTSLPALTTTEISVFNTAQLSSFTTTQASSLTTSQIVALVPYIFPGQVPVIFTDATQTQIAGMGESGIWRGLYPADLRLTSYTTAQNTQNTLKATYQNALSQGCSIASTSSSTLNGTYAIDPLAVQQIIAEGLSLLVNQVFTNGTTSLIWEDFYGLQHTFNPTQWGNFQKAIGNYVTMLDQYAAGINSTLPTQPVTIA